MIIRPICALLAFLFAAMPASALVKISIPSVTDRVIYKEDLSPTEMLDMVVSPERLVRRPKVFDGRIDTLKSELTTLDGGLRQRQRDAGRPFADGLLRPGRPNHGFHAR